MSKNKNSNDSKEPDIQKTFEEEIQKPYYQVDYLDKFKLPYDKLDVSVVIITYNRCPYKPGTLKEDNNPLTWSIKTALLQKPPIKEIIIADDKSNDYTENIVKKYQKYAQEKDLPKITYIKTKQRKGISAIRNIGAKQASGKYIMFIDDDCFISPYTIFGAVYTFEELEKKGIKLGAVNIPTYNRSTLPSKVSPKKEIGLLDFIKGIHKSNKDAFPEEYLKPEFNSQKFLNSELQILNPFQILNLNTIALISKKVFEEVGGFPEHLLKRMEDREFGCRINENGYSIYFQPDPKFHCVHGAYGLKTGKKFIGIDWFKKLDKVISLKKAMQICDNPQENTGARINPKEYIYESILTFFCLVYDRNKNGAIKWIKKAYDEFVKEGKTGLFGNENIPVPSENERKEMWVKSLNEGLKFIREKEKRDLKKINSAIKKFKDKSESSENILSIIEGL